MGINQNIRPEARPLDRKMAMLQRCQGPLLARLSRCPGQAGMAMKAMTPEEHKISREDFWKKNDRLQRPMSPHLTIYKMQMTSVLSITHRFTGLAQSGIMYGYAILAVASSQNHAALLAQVQGLGLGPAVITAAKFAIAWPFVYHLFNGLRHLSWDMGKGFQMTDLYKTGWTVVALSVVFAAALALM